MFCKGIDALFGGWVHGFFCEITETLTVKGTDEFCDSWQTPCIIVPGDKGNTCHKIVEGTECFYTGLNIMSDSGEKQRIYLNDIIRCEDYTFLVKFGRCGENAHKDCGFQGFYVEGYDKLTKKFFNKGLRKDILYWLNHYKPEVIGNIKDKENNPVTIDISIK